MAKNLTTLILIGMLLGLVVGLALNFAFAPADPTLVTLIDLLRLLSDVFLRLVKMIIAPLVFAALVTGIANMDDSAALGRIGGRALLWFLCASVISLLLGLALVNLFRPGEGLALEVPAGPTGLAEAHFSLRRFVLELFPTSLVDAMATNNVLQILVFSLFAGVGCAALGPKAAPLVRVAEALMQLMLQITGYVMRFAPIAVFGALAAAVAQKGLGIVLTYGKMVAEFYCGLALLWAILFGLASAVLGRRALALARYIRQPVLIAFASASSESAFPTLLERLDRFGVPRRIAGFVLPLGYSFNLDGSMMYMSFATLFIAQAYGIHLSFGQQAAILFTLMISSKGVAAVPRASLVVTAATLPQFNLPAEGIGLLLGIDTFLDMGRTCTNLVGNSVATAVITRWEGMLQPMRDPDAEHPHAASDTPEHGKRGLNLDPDV